jgi:hypothetical protein
MMEQENAIAQVVLSKLRRTTIVAPDQQETVSYRLAEILVAARTLYTDVLPAFLELPERAPTSEEEQADHDDEVFEAFGEVRMHLLQLRDLVEDFEESFLESLNARLEAQKGEDGEGEDDDVV